MVASVVGPEHVGEPLKLVDGGTEEFYSLLRTKGIGESMATSLCQTLQVYAARTLFQQEHPELPSAFVAQLENAQEVSLVYS